MRYADARCKCTEQYTPRHTYTFTGPCVVTGEQYSVTVNAEDLFAYRQGARLNDAFKNLSCDDREFLLSGLSPTGWAETFKDVEE